MAKIDVFKAANTTGIAINNQRITKTKPYGFIETVQSYDVNDDEILSSLNFDKKAILKHLDSLCICVGNAYDTSHWLLESDMEFIEKQIKFIKELLTNNK